MKHFTMSDDAAMNIILIEKENTPVSFVVNAGDEVLSDGRYLFYSKRRGRAKYNAGGTSWDSWAYELYRLDLETGRREKLIDLACDNLVLYACDGDYLYCGGSKSLFGADLYAVDLSTCEATFMVSGVYRALLADGRVVVGMNHSVGVNLPVYSFAKGGSDKMQIAEALEVKVLAGWVHYVMFSGDGKYKEFSCSPTGENQEAVTDWTSDFDWRDWI